MDLTSVMVEMNAIRLQFVKYSPNSDGSFTDSAIVEIEYGYEVVGSKQPVLQENGLKEFRISAFHILNFIESQVKKITREIDGSLCIDFDGDHALRIIDGQNGFDSFHVHLQDLQNWLM